MNVRTATFRLKIIYWKIVKNHSITLSIGMGRPMSTLWYSLLSCDDPMSVKVFNVSLSNFSPSVLLMSHLSVKSFSMVCPDACFAMIFIFPEFRILHTVEVDWAFLVIKIFFSNILLTSVVFPELVSPAILIEK